MSRQTAVVMRLLATAMLFALGLSSSAGEQKANLGAFTENVVTQRDPEQTYTLYLPSGYSTAKRWPLLLVFDARQRGTAAAEIFREAAEKHGWIIISSNQTRSDGDVVPNLEALNALWPEASTRFASDPARMYATGFSGGGVLALMLAAKVPLAGVINSSGRPTSDPVRKSFAHFGTAGTADFNYLPMRKIDEAFAASGAPHRFESFEGPHRWMPKEIAAMAIEWMDLVAMRTGLAPRDPAAISAAFVRELARGITMHGKGERLRAASQLGWMLRTFEGLTDVGPARAALEALERDPLLKRERDEEKRAFAYEHQTLQLLPRALAQLANEDGPPPEVRLPTALRISGLHAKAKGSSHESAAAQRVIESFFAQTSFSLHRSALASRDYGRAIALLRAADELKPRNPVVLYNLACTYALRPERKMALATLRRAVDAGYRDPDHLSADPDLVSLRHDPAFKQIVEELKRAQRAAQ
jgi:predicted esterase